MNGTHHAGVSQVVLEEAPCSFVEIDTRTE